MAERPKPPGIFSRAANTFRNLFSSAPTAETVKPLEISFDELISKPTIANLHHLMTSNQKRIENIKRRKISEQPIRDLLKPDHREPYKTRGGKEIGIEILSFLPTSKDRGYFTVAVSYPLATGDGEKVITSFQLSNDSGLQGKPLSEKMKVINERVKNGKLIEKTPFNIVQSPLGFFELRKSGNEIKPDSTNIEKDGTDVARQMYGYLARHHQHAQEALDRFADS